MTDRAQVVAAEFCALVQSTDLLEYLGLPRSATPDACTHALAAKRVHLQAMQANPKFRDSARFLIKHNRHLQAALTEPAVHLEHMRQQRAEARVPMLRLAIDAILADGHFAPSEEAFARNAAHELEIDTDRYEEILRERAAELGVTLPDNTTHDAPERRARTRYRAAEGYGWWDESFTRLLLESVPGGPGELVDVYCRTAVSARTLLPERPQLTYTGVDRSEERLHEAADQVEDLGTRVTLVTGTPASLPVPDASADYVLAIRALANLSDTRPVFDEAMRVLRPGGRMIVAEPDGLAECFYFEGHLAAYNRTFHRLVAEVDAVLGAVSDEGGRPGLALGPQLPARMQLAGLSTTAVHVHASAVLRPRTFRSLSKRLRHYPEALARAAHLPPDNPTLREVYATVDDLSERFEPDQVGVGGHVLPMFLCVGTRN